MNLASSASSMIPESGLTSDLVEFSEVRGSLETVGILTAGELELSGQGGPWMDLTESMEGRFVFPGGMGDFVRLDEVTPVIAIKNLRVT